MKKVISLFIVFAFILSITIINANATSGFANGTAVKVDGSLIITKTDLDAVEPGSDIWIVLGNYDPNNQVKKVKIEVGIDGEKLVSKTNSATFKQIFERTTSGYNKYYAVKIPINNYDASYETFDQGLHAAIKITVTAKKNSSAYFNGVKNFYSVYNENKNATVLSDNYKVLTYNNGEDIYITSDDQKFVFKATGSSTQMAKISLNNDKIEKVVCMFPDDSNLTFYNGSGEIPLVRYWRVSIEPYKQEFLYKYENDTLIDISSYYNESLGKFIIRDKTSSYTLTSYILSDKEAYKK